jgi:two-component system, NarL family, response regulator DegU
LLQKSKKEHLLTLKYQLPMNNKLKILVVDDHPIFLKGLVEVLQDEMPNAEILPQTSSLKALGVALNQLPDIAILDLDMPEMNGIMLGTELKTRTPALKIIILTMHKEQDIIRSVMAKGIDGYVFKDDAVNDVVMAIQEVMNGGQYISKSTSLLQEDSNNDLLSVLTKTEILVLKAISNHKTSREIADTLYVSIKTVENHRNNISRKLNLQGSNSLLKFALNNKAFI